MQRDRKKRDKAMDNSPQVENTASSSGQGAESGNQRSIRPERHRLPPERQAITHHFSVGGQEGYLTVGLYEDGMPGELFLKMAKEGSTVSGLMDSFATAVSLALQYGVPLPVLCQKFSHMRFEPSGWSGNPDIGYAKSIMDYIFRWLALRFLQGKQQKLFAMPAPQAQAEPARTGDAVQALGEIIELGDAPACVHCGSLMVRNGSCYRCMTCGSTSGCS
jgi:ribonucleoside-diphosphate reductase alpha chain